MNRLFFRPRLALAAVLMAATGAWAQGAAPVLKSSQVTEDALVDALAVDVPEPADAASGATRGFRPSVRPASASTQSARPAAPGKANLLITFATGSAELTPETIKVLETVAQARRSDRLAGFACRIEGHADPQARRPARAHTAGGQGQQRAAEPEPARRAGKPPRHDRHDAVEGPPKRLRRLPPGGAASGPAKPASRRPPGSGLLVPTDPSAGDASLE